MGKDDPCGSVDPSESASEVQASRLKKFLETLEARGVSQSEAARRAKIPAQYLSDIKAQRRTLSERLARRLEDAFKIDYLWLLGQRGSMDVPPIGPARLAAPSRRVWLPVFPYPICGDPYQSQSWDGSAIELTGVAAARVLHAELPYVLRFGVEDRGKRLCKGDLVLISQAVNETAEIQIIKLGGKAFLARRLGNQWVRLNPAAKVEGVPAVVGHCLGIVWGPL